MSEFQFLTNDQNNERTPNFKGWPKFQLNSNSKKTQNFKRTKNYE